MKFFAAALCTLFVAQAIALPLEDALDGEFDAALEVANEEESSRVARNVGYGQPAKGYSAPAPAKGYGHQQSHGYGHQQSHGYGHGGHHAQVHAYPVASPKVQCGHNLLLSCAPNVAHVPCQPHHGHGYGHKESHGYGHQQSHGYAAPAHHGGYKAAEYAADDEEMGYNQFSY